MGFIRSVTSQGKTVRYTSVEKNASFLTSSVSVLKSTFEDIRDTQDGISKTHLEKMLLRFTSSFSLLNSAFEYSLVERDERRIT